VKKLIKRLEAARGNGTSMISLIIRTSLSGCPTRLSIDIADDPSSAEGPGLSCGEDVG
jgi:hypothetical protein